MTDVWLFGEMSINMDDTPQEFFKKACDIAENCGYTVTMQNSSKELQACNIIINGEDSEDSYIIENSVNVWENKLSSLQKVYFKIEYKGTQTFKKMLCVRTYDKVSESWKISFDCRDDLDLQKCLTHEIIDTSKQEEDHFIPEKSTYDNDLDLDTVRELMLKLKEAFDIAAEGGLNPSVKWGDNDESDAISYMMSQIQKKYQDKATLEQRTSWRPDY